MDFYLIHIRFRTDLAVNAKSCVNSNKGISYIYCVTEVWGIDKERKEYYIGL